MTGRGCGAGLSMVVVGDDARMRFTPLYPGARA